MPAADHRLTTEEMAHFVADGFLRFEALVPEALNDAVLAELAPLEAAKIRQAVGKLPGPEGPPGPASLTPLSECYPSPSCIGEILRLPQIQGIIESLVGPDPLFDHDFVHRLPAGSGYEPTSSRRCGHR